MRLKEPESSPMNVLCNFHEWRELEWGFQEHFAPCLPSSWAGPEPTLLWGQAGKYRVVTAWRQCGQRHLVVISAEQLPGPSWP